MIDKYIKISDIKSIMTQLEISGYVNKNDFLKEVAKLIGHRKPKKERKFHIRNRLDKIRLIKNYQQNCNIDENSEFSTGKRITEYRSLLLEEHRIRLNDPQIANTFFKYAGPLDKFKLLLFPQYYNENDFVTQNQLLSILKISKPTFYKWVDEKIIIRHWGDKLEYFDLEEIKKNLYDCKS